MLTDKALKCCTDDKLGCRECPYEFIKCITDNNENSLHKDALDLINRLKAKNQELEKMIVTQRGLIDYQKAEIERLEKYSKMGSYTPMIKLAKSEAYKEFAERLKTRFIADSLQITIDEVLAELTEGNGNA